MRAGPRLSSISRTPRAFSSLSARGDVVDFAG